MRSPNNLESLQAVKINQGVIIDLVKALIADNIKKSGKYRYFQSTIKSRLISLSSIFFDERIVLDLFHTSDDYHFIDHGVCFGYSFLYSYYAQRGELQQWKDILFFLASWSDGEWLLRNPTLCSAYPDKYPDDHRTLRELLEYVSHQILFHQIYQNEIFFIKELFQSSERQHMKSYYMSNNFEVMTDDMLVHILLRSRSLFRCNGLVFIISGFYPDGAAHACALRFECNAWFFCDPNVARGEFATESIAEIVKIVFNQLGPKLAFTIGTWSSHFDVRSIFSNFFNEALVEQKKNIVRLCCSDLMTQRNGWLALIRNQGIYFLAEHSPAGCRNILYWARKDALIRDAIIDSVQIHSAVQYPDAPGRFLLSFKSPVFHDVMCMLSDLMRFRIMISELGFIAHEHRRVIRCFFTVVALTSLFLWNRSRELCETPISYKTAIIAAVNMLSIFLSLFSMGIAVVAYLAVDYRQLHDAYCVMQKKADKAAAAMSRGLTSVSFWKTAKENLFVDTNGQAQKKLFNHVTQKNGMSV
jgi:hypothetical protein